MFSSLTKLLCPSMSLTEEFAIKKETASPADFLFSIGDDFKIPNLNTLHRSLQRAQKDEEAAKLAPFIYGPDWDKLLTMDEARRFVDKWLDDNNLEIGQSSFNLLSENRREPYSNYAMKTRRLKGNRHIYGKLPFIQAKRTIFQLVLHKWLEDSVKPHAKTRKGVS